MNKINKILFFICLLVLVNVASIAQISNPISISLDTLYLPGGTMTPTIDPNPGSNPFITDSAGSFSSGNVTMDDPGGPGSGGGGFDPPDDAAIPLDGGVAGLLLAGAVIGLKRKKKGSKTEKEIG